MQVSTEIRWFFNDQKMISEIEAWFAGYGLQLTKGKFERQDYYLKLPGVASLGLKIREPKKNDRDIWQGKLEAKVLVKELDMPLLTNGNSGKANQWTKFSFNLANDDSTLVEIINSFSAHNNISPLDPNHWIQMDKNRILVKYDFDKKTFAKDDNETKIAEGCGIELTAVQLTGILYYSLGLEAFSNSGKQEENLFETIKYLFSELKVPGLSKENSLTYPEFLSSKI